MDLKLFARPGYVTLHYEVDVLPRAILPTAFVERIIQADLPRNLRAIANRAQALMTSAPALLTSAEGVASTSYSENGNVNGSSTALPPSLVTVATGAGAGLDLEVSWWSGPGQPPNPGLIGQASGGTAKRESKKGEDGRGDELVTGSDGGASTMENGKGPNGQASGNGQLKVEKSNGKGVENGAAVKGTPRKEVNGLHDRESRVEAKEPTNDLSKKESKRAQDALLETTPRSAVEGPIPGLVPKSADTAMRTVRWKEDREWGRKADSSDATGKMTTEPDFELIDAPYFPAECPVIPPEDRDIRAGFKQRVDEVHLRRLDDLLVSPTGPFLLLFGSADPSLSPSLAALASSLFLLCPFL